MPTKKTSENESEDNTDAKKGCLTCQNGGICLGGCRSAEIAERMQWNFFGTYAGLAKPWVPRHA